MDFAEPIPFAEAIEKLRERGVMPTSLDTEGLRALDVAIRERAFFSARVESARLLQSMRDYLEDFLLADKAIESHGGLRAQGRAEFVANMRELAEREGLGRIDPATGRIKPVIRENDLQDIRSLARLHLIFDTQTEAANEFGYWKQGNDPAVLDVFPAQRFLRVRPVSAPRPYHAANEGAVRRKDDMDFWLSMNRDFGVPWGPWGFNSGMGVEDVDREEAEALGVIGKDEQVKMPDEEFNNGLEASTRDLDGDMGAALARATGGSVAGGVAKPREKTQDGKTQDTRSGEKAPDKGGKVPRLPGTMEPVAVPPRKSPASAKLAGLDAHPDAATLRAALSVIDSVHDDGGLGEVLLRATAGTVNVGEYSFSGRDGKPKWIEISTRGPWPELTLLHEVGHWIDQQAFGGRNGFGTATGAWPEMAKLLTEGETAKEIHRRIKTLRSKPGGVEDIYPWHLASLKDSIPPEEMFARGYVQWLTTRSGHPRLKEQLSRANQQRMGLYGLLPEDATQFGEMIQHAFKKKGWL